MKRGRGGEEGGSGEGGGKGPGKEGRGGLRHGFWGMDARYQTHEGQENPSTLRLAKPHSQQSRQQRSERTVAYLWYQ